MNKKEIKSIITLIIVIVLSLSFGYVVVRFINESMANQIVSTFLTIATSVVGFYIGYQNSKKEEK